MKVVCVLFSQTDVSRNVMKIFRNNYNRNLLEKKVNKFIEPLRADYEKNQKKIIEICHVGKFLSLLNNEININRIFEEPDFILNDGNKIIGLEHQVIINTGKIQIEGFYKNIFQKVEIKIQNEYPEYKFLANCYLKNNLLVELSRKEYLINEIYETVIEFLRSNILNDNEIIEDILVLPHKKVRLSTNFGGWTQKFISEDVIYSAINKKEKKISNYIDNCGKRQWLLMVIGGLGETSYEMDENLKLSFDSKFDEIYIIEDFNNVLYKIK